MNAIQGVLYEELENLIRIKERYVDALLQIKKGCLRKKIVNGKEYFYLAYREGVKVKYSYLGKLSEQQIKEYRENQKKRKEYQKSIRTLNQQIKYLRKVVNVRTK
ncbi:MAG: hypothetical protein AB9903_25335 [Vulcanimicrobiota bacterium]